MLGDAMGGAYESPPGGQCVIAGPVRLSRVSDDTQLTLATCSSLCQRRCIDPCHIADTFLEWYQKGQLSGLGSSTLKALRDLQMGTPWYSAGAMGDRSAGNGAAMRIAPIAFLLSADDPESLVTVRDVCSITHRHDESFVAALAVVEAIWYLQSNGDPAEILPQVAERLPDTLVRDRMLDLSRAQDLSIGEAAEKFGSSGYAVDSIPLALFAASKINSRNFNLILEQIVRAGGDTDTNASITGQVAGVAMDIPEDSIVQLAKLSNFRELEAFVDNYINLYKK